MGILTTAGLAKLAQAQQTGVPIIVDQIIFAYYPGLNPATTPPVSISKPTVDKIVHTATVISGFINNDTVVYKTQLLPNIGNFSFNWVGLFSSATNTLIAVSYQEIQVKNKTEGFTTGNIIVKSFAIQYAQLKSLTGVTVEAGLDSVDIQELLDQKSNTNHTHIDLAPITHAHPIMEITDLQATLNAKAQSVHTHAIANISNLQSTLDEKSPANHTHIDFASNVHTHFVEDISYLQLTLDAKAHVSHKHTDIVNQLEAFATKDLANATNPFLILSASFNNAYVAGGSGFLRTKNGLLMQYGSMQPGGSSVFVSFPTPFASRNYMIIGCRTLSNMDTGGIENTYVPVFGNNFEYKQTTYCRFTSQSGADNFISWIAIGT